jgi:selenocysteine lyase/cysteine desulfurase
VAIGREVFDRLDVLKIEPGPTTAPDKLETGTQNHEGLAGLLGAIAFISSIGFGDALRAKLLSGIEIIRIHEENLARDFRPQLADVRGLRLFAPPDAPGTPTFAFTVAGHSSRSVATRLAQHGVFVGDGNFYASTLNERLGTQPNGGWVRVGLAPYTTAGELARCLDWLYKVAREA